MPTTALKIDEYQRPFGLIYTTNPNWKHTQIEQDPENSQAFQVCQWLYGRAGGFCKVGLYGKHNLYATEVMTDYEKMASIIGSRRYKQSNTVMSVATYRDNKDGTQKNLLTINALCIDVDFSTSRNRDIRDLEANEAVYKFYSEILLNDIIPMPTYIEYGRNFRLIYVLYNPYLIPKAEKKRKSVLTFLRRIIQVISETIQAEDDWGVDNRYNVTPYIRVPESVNIRWENYMDNPHPISIHEVNIWQPMQYNILWDIERLADNVLLELPDWYDEYKSKQKKQAQKKKDSNVIRINPFGSLFKKRMEDLEALQSLGWDIGYRETMTYLYRLTAIQSGMTENEALDAAIAFNRGFAHPLKEREVENKCKPSNNEYKYKNTTIRELLNLGDKIYPHLFEGDGLSRHDRYERDKEKYKANKIENGFVSKSQKLDDLYLQILELKKQNMKQKEIADTLNIPIRTIKRYYSAMKSKGMFD